MRDIVSQNEPATWERRIANPRKSSKQRLYGAKLTFGFPDAELVFGIVCAVGGNYHRVEKELANLLKLYGYEPITIRLTSFLPNVHKTFRIENPLLDATEYDLSVGCLEYTDAVQRFGNLWHGFEHLPAMDIETPRPRNPYLTMG